MYIISFIGMLIGAVGFLLVFTGFSNFLPIVERVPLTAWIAVFVVSMILAMLTRRPSN